MTRIADETDNEVARAIIRRRDHFYVLPYTPFEDARDIFSDGRCTYYIDREGHGFHTGDHWQSHHDYFRPADHLMDTILDLVRAARERQDRASHADKAQRIIEGARA